MGECCVKRTGLHGVSDSGGLDVLVWVMSLYC